MPVVYILRCADDTFYVGHTHELASRVQMHNAGLGAGYTSARLPVSVVYSETHDADETATQRERQLKRWSGKKKQALIAGDFSSLKRLSRRRRPKRSRK